MIRRLAALLVAGAAQAAAGDFSDLVMAPGLFDPAPPGPILAYEESPATDGGPLVLVRLEPADGATLVLRRGADPFATFPGDSTNPILLYFLESTLRDMAEATGGSPYYIRNRMREALGSADLSQADGEVTLKPFATDRNRARMGPFADLTLRFRFDPAAPARLLELSADTSTAADGYHHRLTLAAGE